MSATNRGAKRRAGDFYGTPAYCVWRLLDYVPLPSGRWLEPGAGTGAIIRATAGDPRVSDVRWTAVEKRKRPIRKLLEAVGGNGSVVRVDFLREPLDGQWDLAIGNPPYRLAAEFIERALALAPRVVFLLRLGFLASRKRCEFYKRVGVPDVHTIPDRPSFTGDGSDATEYAWFEFRREWACRIEGRTSILYPPALPLLEGT